MPSISDPNGLNLNATVTLIGDRSPNPDYNLPVHKGGFFFESSSYLHYDQARIVQLAAQDGYHLIAICYPVRR